jgi:hypothetical protein
MVRLSSGVLEIECPDYRKGEKCTINDEGTILVFDGSSRGCSYINGTHKSLR